VTEFLQKKVYIEGHGCSASFADTEILRGMISQGGYDLVDDDSAADVNVLVTCSVKSVTEERMFERIRSLSNEGKKLIVAGCLPKANPARIEKFRPGLSMIGPNNLDSIFPTIEATLSGRSLVSVESRKLVKTGLPRSRINKVIGIVEISSGCLSSCTFCQVKLVKGTVFSYPEVEIIKEVEQMVSQGVKEIWLTSTDNAAYGRDSHSSLPRLVRRVTSIPGDFVVRLGMMNPLLMGGILDELIDSFKNEKVFKFLHLPVQSGCDRILKLMQRGYLVEDFYRTLDAFRCEIPDLTLSTDIIVGFPTETESEFRESIELLKKVKPDVVNLSRFGARPGTKASTMDSQTSPEISKERSTEMTILIRRLSRERNEKWIGWSGKVLIDEVVKNAVVGRNFAYKPCLLSGKEDSEKLGRRMELSVVGATASTLHAELWGKERE
jgi:threonylcarbamoyladenosine tRNA methylthiotransferase CDKAL1